MAAVSLDFYQTLVYPRGGIARGPCFVEYCRSQGISHRGWRNTDLYALFAYYDQAYPSEADEAARGAFWQEFAARLFVRLEARVSPRRLSEHAVAVREIFGPDHFAVFDDVIPALTALQQRGVPLMVISNWPLGLDQFLTELGLRERFRVVVGSAAVGLRKPEPAIFIEACKRLGVPTSQVLHVGDQMLDDVVGASAAGVRGVWLNRHGDRATDGEIASLAELPALLEA
ncbi:MAG: HAD family hydrolase [Planctomycetota bacterium]